MPVEKLHNEPLLILQLRDGDQEAFTTLYRYYSPILYVNIQRMVRDPLTTEELVQELFTRIWHKRTAKGVQEDFQGYMYRIAQNLVHDFFRRLKKDHILMERFRASLEETDKAASAEEILQRQQSRGIINNAIEHLPPQQKKAYKLVKEEGYTYQRAAEDMGISPFTVKEYLSLANKSIRAYILNHVGSPGEIVWLVLVSISLF